MRVEAVQTEPVQSELVQSDLVRQPVRVWDLATRVFHWALVILMIVSFVTAKVNGSWMQWHFYSGFAILSLVSFRLIWGFVGGHYSRFTNFLFSPRAIIAYLKSSDSAPRTLGHNPLGSLSVYALLFSVAMQATTGLFVNDDISNEGPLSKFVSNATVALLTTVHRLNEKVLIALVLLHVAAITFYLIRKKENLIRPMINGDKLGLSSDPVSTDNTAKKILAALVLAACASIVAWVVRR